LALALDQIAKRILMPFPVGEVPRDFAEPPQPALGVAQGRDDDVAPEQRAVLADPPPFLFDAALGFGDGQEALGLAALDVVGRIEAAEVLADDLVACVALQALSPWVPTRDDPVGVEGEDRVLGCR